MLVDILRHLHCIRSSGHEDYEVPCYDYFLVQENTLACYALSFFRRGYIGRSYEDFLVQEDRLQWFQKQRTMGGPRVFRSHSLDRLSCLYLVRSSQLHAFTPLLLSHRHSYPASSICAWLKCQFVVSCKALQVDCRWKFQMARFTSPASSVSKYRCSQIPVANLVKFC